MKIYIYVIWFPTSKRPNPYYIGIAENLERRMFQHLKNKSLVGNTLNKYNNWIIKKLHTCKTYEEAFKLEIEEIRNFNCVAPNGYNMTHGGEGGILCDEAIEKIRRASLGNKSAQGFHHTEETKKKMQGNKNGLGCKQTKESNDKRSRALQGNKNAEGNKHSKETKKKMRIAQLKRRIREAE